MPERSYVALADIIDELNSTINLPLPEARTSGSVMILLACDHWRLFSPAATLGASQLPRPMLPSGLVLGDLHG